ncbi:hypothetical protein [Aurantiacibacter gangjinensis]|nr:hypothetical protein [Aurantiacibacter gangjinensis]APE27760.1 hypothetical protein BMF35_a0931 [Aurantiacibacter gangjinensis]
MSRFITQSAAALLAIVIMAGSFSAITSVPAEAPLAVASAPQLA